MSNSTSQPRRSVRLSPEEVWTVLAESHTGILTTLRRDGTPISLPVWFVALDGEIFTSTPERAKKVLRLHHDPRCGFLVESGQRWVELLGVHLSGTARVIPETDPLAITARAALDAKYDSFRTAREDMPTATASHYAKVGQHIMIRLTPQGRVLSWNNAALGLA